MPDEKKQPPKQSEYYTKPLPPEWYSKIELFRHLNWRWLFMGAFLAFCFYGAIFSKDSPDDGRWIYIRE